MTRLRLELEDTDPPPRDQGDPRDGERDQAPPEDRPPAGEQNGGPRAPRQTRVR